MDETTPVVPQSSPPAGWYPDPLDGGQDRWWTGEGWSEHVQQRVPVAPPGFAQPAYPPPTTEAYVPMSYSAPQFAYSNPESEPLPGASIGQAFVRFWSKYAVFTGRASRSEYWWWTLSFTILYAAILILAAVQEKGSPAYLATSIVLIIFVLASIIPSYALVVRRLHDANLSGWNYFWYFIPFVGGILLLVFLVRPSDPAGRRFDSY